MNVFNPGEWVEPILIGVHSIVLIIAIVDNPKGFVQGVAGAYRNLRRRVT